MKKHLIIMFASVVLLTGYCARQACAVTSNNLIVTEVRQDTDTYRVVIDSAVEIRNILMVFSNGITTPEFPRGVKVLNQQGKDAISNSITKGISGKIVTNAMSYKIGDIVISTNTNHESRLPAPASSAGMGAAGAASVGFESSTSTVHWNPARQVSNGAKAKCSVTFNNGLELTAYIFDRDGKRRVSWPQDVKFKNHLLNKMIGKSVLNKYKVFTGEK